MLPALADGTPLCLRAEILPSGRSPGPSCGSITAPGTQTDRINAVARERNEPLLKRYGGIIGLEWFFPKDARNARERSDRLRRRRKSGSKRATGSCGSSSAATPQSLPRSTCQAGYKGMWSAEDGYPSTRFSDSRASEVGRRGRRRRCRADWSPPGEPAGELVDRDGEETRPAAGHAGQRRRSSMPTPACPARVPPSRACW